MTAQGPVCKCSSYRRIAMTEAHHVGINGRISQDKLPGAVTLISDAIISPRVVLEALMSLPCRMEMNAFRRVRWYQSTKVEEKQHGDEGSDLMSCLR